MKGTQPDPPSENPLLDQLPGGFLTGWAQSLFVWVVWALMTVGNLVFVLGWGSRFPNQDDWEMVPAITGNQPITLEWLWSQHGWYCDGEVSDLTAHRLPLGRLILFCLGRISGADFRAGMVFAVLLLSLLAFLMIRTAERLRGWIFLADAFFPLAILHWGHAESFFWSEGNRIHLPVAIVSGLLLVLIVNRKNPFSLGFSLIYAGLLVLLFLSGGGGVAQIPALALGLAYSVVFFTRKTQSKSQNFVILFLAVLCLCLPFLYMIGMRPYPDSHWLEPTPWERVQTGVYFMAQGPGPTVARSLWPISGIGILALVVGSVAVAIVYWRKNCSDRCRIGVLFFFLGGFLSLAVTVGYKRAIPSDISATAPTLYYSYLGLPFLCWIYLIWLICTKKVAPLIHVGLFVFLAGCLWSNTRFGLKMAESQRWLTVGYRDVFQSQLSPSLIADLWWDRPVLEVTEPQFGKKYWARGLEMMRKAGIDGFASLKKDSDFSAVSLVLDPIHLNNVQWNNGVAKGSDEHSRITFALPEAKYVDAIRVAFRYQQGKPENLGVIFRKTRDEELSEGVISLFRGYKVNQEGTVLARVNDTIDQVILHLGLDPCVVELLEITLFSLKNQ